jgi:WS/DGAT/MGAT family acyltransferase
MRRLRGADAFHLYKETRTQHMHTIKVQVLQPHGETIPFDEFKRGFETGIAAVPPFHWQLVKVPFGLGHPLWRYRTDLDLDYHVRRMAAPAPGGDRELAEVISEIASTGLERDRPLFQVWLVEGLAGGRVAYVTKLHHAVADGVSSATILLDAFQSDPEAPDRHEHEWQGDESEPDRWSLIVDALRHLVRLAAGAPAMIGRLWRVSRISLQRIRAGLPRAQAPFSGRRTRFNRRLTPHRWYAFARLSVSDMKRVKQVLGGTLNDVFVALCAASVRAYLMKRSELPGDFALTGTIPVNIRKDHEQRTYGNRTGSWTVSLATNEADPLARYRAVIASTRAGRESSEAKDPALIADSMDYWWIHNLVLSGLRRVMGALTGRPPFHTILSNVKGPSEPIYSRADEVVDLLSMGPIVDDQGLNFTGWSYRDAMNVGIVACREHVPDVWDLADGVRDALAELVAIADAEEARRSTAADHV